MENGELKMENEHTHTAILHFQFSIINYQLLIINRHPNARQVGQGNLPLDHLHASETVVGYEQVAIEVGKIDRGRELGSTPRACLYTSLV